MIVVSLGTQKQQFTRALELVEKADVIKNEEIVVQAGNTKYQSARLKMLGFTPLEEFEDLLEKSDLVICHGGVGTIFSALKKGKKVLVVPRLEKYGEHINDHQIEICEMLYDMGYINYYKDGEDFNEVLKNTINTEYRKYIPDESFMDKLRKEI